METRFCARAGGSWLRGLVYVLTALFCLLEPTSGHADCVVRQATSVGLSMVGGRILVQVEVNGIPSSFILDTGAQRSVVTEAAIRRLGLARDQWVGTTMSGIGGINRRANANPRSFTLAGVPLVRRTLNHDTSLTVGVLPGSSAPGPVVDGLLGRDYLSLFDLDLDIPALRLSLFQPVGCSGRFLPWADNYIAVPISNPTENALVVPVVLDGIPLRALLDTGASGSLLGAAGIFRLKVDLASLGSDATEQVSGLGPHIVTLRRHQFRSLSVGGQSIGTPLLWVAPLRLTPIVDMLLGADWLAGRRVWISYATHQLFIAVP